MTLVADGGPYRDILLGRFRSAILFPTYRYRCPTRDRRAINPT